MAQRVPLVVGTLIFVMPACGLPRAAQRFYGEVPADLDYFTLAEGP